MRRLAIQVIALSMIACGTQSRAPSASPADPPGVPETPGSTVGIASANLSASTTAAKVVVSTTVPVEVPIEPSNSYGEPASVPCTPSGTDCAAYETYYPGVHCAAIPGATANECAVTVQKATLFYVTNVSVQAGAFSFPLPCDGRSYQAEVYGASGGVIVDAKKTAAPVSFDATCSGAPATWVDQTAPALVLPTIYAGLPAPYDRYTVAVQGVAYPWSSAFALKCNGASPTTYLGAGATFVTPSPGDVDCTGTFQLDRSILTSAELANPWTFQATAHTTTVGFAPVASP